MSPLHRMLSTHCSQRGAQGQQGFCPASGSPAGQGQGAAPHGYGWQSSSHSVTGGRVVLPGLPEPSLLCLQYGDSDPYFARLCAKWAGLTLAILSLTSEVQRRGQDRSPVVCVSLLGGWASGPVPCAVLSLTPRPAHGSASTLTCGGLHHDPSRGRPAAWASDSEESNPRFYFE